jgi:hypothetical protein
MDVAGSQQPLAALAPGDVVLITFAGAVTTSVSTSIRAVVVLPDGSIEIVNGCLATVGSSALVSGVGQYVALRLGTHALKLQALITVSGSMQTSALGYIALTLRP